MDIFNKYKSHFIAAIVTLAFFGLFIILLFIKPFGDSMSKNQDDKTNQQVVINFQKETTIDEPLPTLPTNADVFTEKSFKETQNKEIASSEDVEKEPQTEEVAKIPAKEDSALIADIKKAFEKTQSITPSDSLPHDSIQKPQKVQTDITRNSYEDRKFIYENYSSIMSLKKVYPYVQKTKEIMTKLNNQLASTKSNKERHLLIKRTEKELYVQFEKDIRNMSTSQGKLLLKLIARETNQSAYGIIKTYKGVIPATFWYGVGLLFHENMKLKYDSLGEDAQLEKIVQKYKLGKL